MTLEAVLGLLRTRHVASAEEQCGFIVNLDGLGPCVLTVRNVWAGDRRHGFEMHPGEQEEIMRHHGQDLIGLWHTHPTGPDGPSTHDLKFKPPGMRCWVVTPTSVVEYTDMEYKEPT
jgi:proteasome lid subunit RPN8/RPN11